VLLVHMCGGMARMDEIMAICREHNLTLVEDAGQAFGASYKGTSVGLFGKCGSYSFDFFKIATAGEGGVMVTNDETCYKLADSYADHGHDHIGDNRGMENHPILGFNYRISELHAAVGLAQTRKVPHIREVNRKHKQILQEELSSVEGIGFSHLPDPSGDSATFLNLLLPDPKVAERVVEDLRHNNVGGCNYWYTNKYEFINLCNQLKKRKSTRSSIILHLRAQQYYMALNLPTSEDVVGRLITFGIRVTWAEQESKALATSRKKRFQKV